MEEESKSITSIYSFATFLTTYYTELLNIHPFREGNGRTTREFIREYANHKSEEYQFQQSIFHGLMLTKIQSMNL